MGKLEVLWRINGANNSPLLSCFQSVENIHIHSCKRFSNISTPTIPNFPPRAHVDIMIQDSRDLVFNKALKSLDPDSKIQKIALCGVGSVGKTTLMEDLVMAAKDLRMFDSVVKLVIGRKSKPFDLQETTAKCIDEVLKENATEKRAKFLCQKLMQKSQGVKNKILVILDDLWQEMDLKGIGLPDPLPNGVKLLITSRDENVCSHMGVTKISIFTVPLLEGPEAKALFYQTLRPSDGDTAAEELDKIAEDVVKICCGMPFLIKEIASLLESQKRSTWEDAYSNLKENHLNSIYQKWYEKLETEDAKAILLLSGFFHEEVGIHVEDLVRYGWGLKLFGNEVDTLAKARQRITNSIDVLRRANMLIQSDYTRNLWHLVGNMSSSNPLRGFIFSNLTKVKQALIDYDNMPKDVEEPYERILLNHRDMSELPVGFNYQNLKLLKQMYKEQLLDQSFYDEMKNFEVVAYDMVDDPLLPRYSTNLRTLCLDSCSLMGDFPFLGDLTNLEILSFARCSIQKLPSTIGKLKQLKVLDVTQCVELSIDDAVFGDLDKLEELYLNGSKGVCFTATNHDELKIHSLQLSALEVELNKNMLQAKDLSFEKLKKFNIYMGCLRNAIDVNPLKNTLKLVSNNSEVVQYEMNELFDKTEILYLQVKDMQNIEQFSMGNSFSNIKELEVSECAELMFLFTVSVASGFTELESLKVSSCPFLETLIHDESGGGDGRVFKFPKLKFLSLKELPRLVSLCHRDKYIRAELHQLMKLEIERLPKILSIFADDAMQYSFFNQWVQIPNLEKLRIVDMEKLMQIWPSEMEEVNNNNNVSMLREIFVKGCDSLVNLFPINPLPLLNHLEKLYISEYGSIQVIFNMDLSAAGNINEHTSSLREIHVWELENLRERWRIKEGGESNNNSSSSSSPLVNIRCFQAVEIYLSKCPMFRDVFAPKSISFDIRARVIIMEYRW